MSATQATRHPTGITLTPRTWTVTMNGRRIGTISAYGDAFATWHYPAEDVGGAERIGHLIGNHSDDWPRTLDEAIGQILACDRNPDRCAERQAAQKAPFVAVPA